MQRLQLLHNQFQAPLIITSGYRCPEHPIEQKKPSGPGLHSQGIAADIKIYDGNYLYDLVKLALEVGFTGVGVGNRAGHKILHLDLRTSQPTIWTY